MVFSFIAISSRAIARTASLDPSLRQQASRSTASWFSSCVQRKLTDSNNIGLRLDINSSSQSKFRPSRSDNTMGTTNAAIKQSTESSAAITDIEDIHRQAILHQQSTYIDPHTGFTVFTELSHLKRGKCCGNQCRHCPYGWSNVRSEKGGFGLDDNARATSGDREETGRLVKRILDGTYYDKEECFNETNADVLNKGGVIESEKCNFTRNTESNSDATSQAPKPVAKGEGKGGSAGGTLTTKNVPYTRKGDSGTSQLFTGERRKKDDVLFEALGTVDELCSIAGVVYAELTAPHSKGQSNSNVETTTQEDTLTKDAVYGDLPEQLLDVMSRLFDVGSHIARPTPQIQQKKDSNDGKKKNNAFHPHHTELLEAWIDTMTDQLPELTSFILPTGSPASAQLHVARTVCRRAERRMVPLVQEEGTVDPEALAYVNRLSDYFFTAARFVNYCEDRDEVQYRREERGLTNSGRNQQRERVVVKLKR